MDKKYKAKANDSFRTKLELYLFDRISSGLMQHINHSDFKDFHISQMLVELFSTVYWQELQEYQIRNKTIAEIERSISNWKSENKPLITEFQKYYVNEMFAEIFPEEKFNLLTKSDTCAYCGITIGQIEKLGTGHKLHKKNYRGWTLEIDRLDSNFEYTPDNTVMACYWCNNAKTDEFTFEEFKLVGRSIKQIWNIRLNDYK